MKKTLVCLVIALLVSCIVFANGNKEAQDKHVLKFSWAESESNVISAGFELIAQKVKEKTNGQVEMQIFYNGSLMSNDAELSGLQSGDLDMTRRDPGELTSYCPELEFLSSPYIFVSWQHCIDTITGPIGDKILETFNNKLGFKCLGLYSLGARIFNTTIDTPVMTPSDLKGVLLRVPGGTGWLNMGNSLGATATPLALTETYTALQTGVVQAQDNPLPGTYSNKFYEVAKQISLTNHMYSIGIICISNKAWDALSEEQQKALKEAVDEGIAKCHVDVEKQTNEMLDFYKQNGVKIVEPNIAAFKQYANDYYQSNKLDSNWSKEIINAINDTAANYL